MAIPSKPTAGTEADIFGTAETDDYLLGTSGDDLITGGIEAIAYVTDGIDIMQGGAGDDIYIVNDISSGTDTIIEFDGEGVDTVFASVNYTLPAFVENIVASAGAVTLTGNSLANILDGSQGTAAAGDTLKGMEGNDTYIIGTNDKVIEGKAGTGTTVTYSDPGGIDTIISKIATTTIDISSAAPGQVDTPTVEGTPVGTSTNRTVAAGPIVGAAYIENVTLDDLALASSITGNIKDNRLTGNASVNTLTGNAGNDTLDGGADSVVDILVGGAGNDTYIKRGSDTITELTGEGTDTIISSASLSAPAFVENITLIGISDADVTGGADLANTIKGNSGDNTLTGGADTGTNKIADTLYGYQGDDDLNGGKGNDTMVGGRGDDVYTVDSTSDVVTEVLGNAAPVTDDGANGTADHVKSSVTFSLTGSGTLAVENLSLTGSAAINATGNAKANILAGNSGVNIIDGGAGADFMRGGTGGDTYIVDNAGDIVTDTGGTDLVKSSAASFNLQTAFSTDVTPIRGAVKGATEMASGTGVENITLTGTGNIDATGNTLKNIMTGNSGANTIDGADNNDTLIGNGGNDTLIGGAGEDKITGGTGKDTVTTGEGGDTIVFASGVTDTFTSGLVANIDLYSDLVLNSDTSDLIDLTVVVANIDTAVTAATGVTSANFITAMNTALTTQVSGVDVGFKTNSGDISAAIVTVTDGIGGVAADSDDIFLAVDLDKSGTFTATDFVIEITGSTVTDLESCFI